MTPPTEENLIEELSIISDSDSESSEESYFIKDIPDNEIEIFDSQNKLIVGTLYGISVVNRMLFDDEDRHDRS